jgi:hypothetical protein
MSKLEFYARPLVAFDPSNKQHRRHYYEFLRSRTWGRCPVRFICPNQTGADLVKMMQTQLVDWYVIQEFKKEINDKPKRTTKGRS